MNKFSNAIGRFGAIMNSIGQSLINYAIEEYSETNHQDYVKKILIDINSPAQLETAIDHRNLNSLRHWEDQTAQKYSFWCSSTWKIGEYSIGFALHFMLLKQLILMMFFIAGASVLLLYINYQGSYFAESETQSDLDFFSIGNIYGERLFSNKSTDSNEMDQNYEYVWICDAACSGFFLLCVFLFLIYSYISVFAHMNKKAKISDYAVEVKGLPRVGLDVEEVKKHFERHGTVVEVFLGRRFGEFLPLYTGKALLTEQKNIQEALLRFKQKDPEQDKTIKKLNKQLEKYMKKIKAKGAICKHEDLEVKRAYIVFNKTEEKIACLKKYNSRNLCGCKRRRKRLRFQKCHLTVMPSTEPCDIIWENLEIGKCSRFFRKLFSFFLTLILLALSVAMLYYVKTAQSKLPSEEDCEISDSDVTDKKPESTEMLCYCQDLKASQLVDKAKDCRVYIEYLTFAWTIKFLSAFGIIIINFLLKTIMRKLTNFEKPRSRSNIQKRVFKKILLVIFINTAILTYLVNLSIPQFTKYVLAGQYDDFSREWFLRVGSYILTLMIISLFSPHLIYLVLAYPLGACRRRFCHRSKKTQFELNNLFTGPDFDIAARTAQVFNVIFTSFLYSGGIPLLNCSCFVFLVVIFYTDKWLVLRHFKKPPRYDHTLYASAIKLLPWAVIFHCSVSLYTYGNPEIFQVKSEKIEILHDIFPEDLAKRIERPSGIANSFIIIAALALMIILGFIDLLCKCCLKRKLKYNTNEMNFLDIKDEISKKSLASYDISKNPNYAMIVNEMNDSVGLRGADTSGYFDSARLAKSNSRMTLASPQKEIDHKVEEQDGDASSYDVSQPDLSRDEKAEINLDLRSIRSPMTVAKHDLSLGRIKNSNESVSQSLSSSHDSKEDSDSLSESEDNEGSDHDLSRDHENIEDRESSED